MHMDVENEIVSLYERLINGWNRQNAAAMAAAIATDGLVIGYDGSQMLGREEVARQLEQIFADHQTATYVTKVRSVKTWGADTGLLHAVVGMVPPGQSEIMSDRNAIQTVVATQRNMEWSVMLFQTTPAQFHGRPELSAALSAELAALLR